MKYRTSFSFKILFSIFVFAVLTLSARGKQQDFVIQSGGVVAIACSGSEAPVVRTSLELLCRDLHTVLSLSLIHI